MLKDPIINSCTIPLLAQYNIFAAKDVAAVYNQVYGIIGGIPIKFPGYPDSQKNACSLGMKCPGKAGDVATETVALPVATSDPSVSYFFSVKGCSKHNNNN